MEWGGNGDGDGEGEVSLRATWDQGGQDRTTQEKGFQVSTVRGIQEKEHISWGIGKGKPARGKTRNCAITSIANLRMCIIMIV